MNKKWIIFYILILFLILIVSNIIILWILSFIYNDRISIDTKKIRTIDITYYFRKNVPQNIYILSILEFLIYINKEFLNKPIFS
ncbi:uncharacterized protein T551_02334 [Pneumocystis jirovecii RU7]|uniref:Uncharacterized protein n=1 Tax=Pneumocystis jirovecii (strain RU7) TaxID=1408657 RepID=A0A0W4ZL06_PNEJ7|nr:uncharacterized protein T551_02334 [Pneumocystis jirovecii RU7]KTW29060.1 hypothetical protein T551_02334 [Pneumocystis jirovecii RU7]